MIPNASIICTQNYDCKGNPEQVICEWEGPKGGVVEISYRLMMDAIDGLIEWEGDLQIGSLVKFGPYRLKVIEWDAWRNSYYLVRKDSLNGRLRGAIYHSTRWLDRIYRRLIITAAVWKLASYHEAQIPGWQDLYIIKRFRKK